MPRDGELKIPDETFRNRNGEPESSTVANSLRTNAGIRGTARRAHAIRRGVRPLGLYFFSAVLAFGALDPAGTGRSARSGTAISPTAAAPASTAAPSPRAAADLFRSTVRPVLLAHCAPCHEPGGKMYDRLPFENPQVVADHRAGVLRRLKGEDRAAVEKWLATLPPPVATP
jgi:cytochrome c553